MDTTIDLLFMEPVFHGKIWGGRKLEEMYGYEIPDGPVGECWGISAHPNGDCKIASGPLAGMFLSQAWDERPELFGGLDGDRFPLLVKILDATDDLSVQVHPGDVYASARPSAGMSSIAMTTPRSSSASVRPLARSSPPPSRRVAGARS